MSARTMHVRTVRIPASWTSGVDDVSFDIELEPAEFVINVSINATRPGGEPPYGRCYIGKWGVDS